MWGGLIRYIGATWLDPAARAEMHLHGDADDPRSLKLRAVLEAEAEAPTIVAVSVPPGADRPAHKTALTSACTSAGLLSPDAIGLSDGGDVSDAVDPGWLAEAVQHVQEASVASAGAMS